jgi:uncharacterized protein YeaO (DUF488 family)
MRESVLASQLALEPLAREDRLVGRISLERRRSMAAHKHRIGVKRVYEPPSKSDGKRVLVDRVWPRGLTKEKAAVDVWLKEVAPSTALRKWFGHDPERWTEFRQRYGEELRENSEAVSALRALTREGPVTLVYGAHDEEHNNAVALLARLRR